MGTNIWCCTYHRYRYVHAHKLDIATSLGAHQTINSKEENLEKFIENHYANQIDLAIESSGAKVAGLRVEI